MTTDIESAIASYTANRSDAALRALDLALIKNSVLVPISSAPSPIGSKSYDIPVICIKTLAGDGAIPAFTTVDQLLKWKPEGCEYVTLDGKSLLKMAHGMSGISQIVVNVDGTPRGAIPRSDFERLIALS